MVDIIKDTSIIWARLFDHRAFLNGEIRFTLHEFEESCSDKEIENLFSVLEKIIDIKCSMLDKLIQSTNNVVPDANKLLSKTFDICDQINDLELKYKEDSTLSKCREKRKVQWEKFVDDISYNCKRTDNTFAEKEEEFQEFYRDLERKLYLTNTYP